MSVALATRWFPTGTSLADAAGAVRGFGLDRLAYDLPGPVLPGRRDALKAVGVSVSAVVQRAGLGASVGDERAFLAGLEAQAALASALRADAAVVDGGSIGLREERDLKGREATLLTGQGTAVADEIRDLREPLRAEAVERAARSLHGAVRAGVPVAVQNGGGAASLLWLEETEWLLDALPGLLLAFDPAAALRLHRLGLGPEAAAWAERFAPRTAQIFVHGLGADLEGGSHPEDGDPGWDVLKEILPARAARILTVDPALAAADVEDAVRYVRHETFATSRG